MPPTRPKNVQGQSCSRGAPRLPRPVRGESVGRSRHRCSDVDYIKRPGFRIWVAACRTVLNISADAKKGRSALAYAERCADVRIATMSDAGAAAVADDVDRGSAAGSAALAAAVCRSSCCCCCCCCCCCLSVHIVLVLLCSQLLAVQVTVAVAAAISAAACAVVSTTFSITLKPILVPSQRHWIALSACFRCLRAFSASLGDISESAWGLVVSS